MTDYSERLLRSINAMAAVPGSCGNNEEMQEILDAVAQCDMLPLAIYFAGTCSPEETSLRCLHMGIMIGLRIGKSQEESRQLEDIMAHPGGES